MVLLEKKCLHCGEPMIDDGNGRYIYCRDANCNWIEWLKEVRK